MKASKEKGIAEDRIRQQTKRINELRFENHELKDANKQLKSERDDFIRSWLIAKDALDKRVCDMKK